MELYDLMYDSIKSVDLALILLFSNYLIYSVPQKTTSTIIKNVYYRYIVLFIVIYTSIFIFNNNIFEYVSPISRLIICFACTLVFYILANIEKMYIFYIFVLFFLIEFIRYTYKYYTK